MMRANLYQSDVVSISNLKHILPFGIYLRHWHGPSTNIVMKQSLLRELDSIANLIQISFAVLIGSQLAPNHSSLPIQSRADNAFALPADTDADQMCPPRRMVVPRVKKPMNPSFHLARLNVFRFF